MKHLFNRQRALLALIVLAGLGGCATPSSRQYIDPTGGEAEACLQHCQGERFACRTPVQRLDEDCQYRYRIVYRQYQKCIQVRGERGGCSRPRPCPVPDYRPCGVGYDRCFVGCGGQILEASEADDRPGTDR